MLILSDSNIKELNADFLINLEYLSASRTALTELSTVGLGKIHFLELYDVKIQTLNALNMPLI